MILAYDIIKYRIGIKGEIMRELDVAIGVISILLGILVLNLNSVYSSICFVFFVAFGILYILYNQEENHDEETEILENKIIQYKLPNAAYLGKKISFEDEILDIKVKLMMTFNDFNIKADIQDVYIGSKLIRFVISFESARSISTLLNNKDALAYSFGFGPLEINGLEEKDTIELICVNPNKTNYPLRNCISAGNKNLLLYVGEESDGTSHVLNLEKNSSIAITGNDNEAISNFLHSMIISLVMKHTPNDLELVLIDNGGLDFTYYNSLPHLKYPVAVKGQDGAYLVDNISHLVDDRLELLDGMDIDEYNKIAFKKLKKVVVFINDLDYMMYSDIKEFEKLQKIIKLGKEIGIYFVFSANFIGEGNDELLGLCDTIIAFSHTKKSKFNKYKKTIIDDCCFVCNSDDSIRIIPSYVDESSIVKIVGFWTSQNDEQ